ncbi:MAG: hypothetical protein WCY89_02510 [Flavobacteriaceae bacterium]
MGKITIQYLSDVKARLNSLVFILYEKEYFSFLESSYDYVDRLIEFIDNDLINFPHKQTPEKLIRFGSKYVFYKANNHTTWYIFFETKDNRYLITYITNNHTEDAKFL